MCTTPTPTTYNIYYVFYDIFAGDGDDSFVAWISTYMDCYRHLLCTM
jgi:hypothetical protein